MQPRTLQSTSDIAEAAADAPALSLHILDALPQEPGTPPASEALGSLQELMETIAQVTGLDLCIYPPPRHVSSSSLDHLPAPYRRHMSDFCRAARDTHDGRGCRGHDSLVTNARAAMVAQPFVQTCHRGVAEVIVPIHHGEEHLGTLFIGQVVTPAIEHQGFDAVWAAARSQVIHREPLRRGFEQLPRMSEQQLLRVGRLADAAIRGLAERLSADAFTLEVRLQGAPAIRRAVNILHKEQCWHITAADIAQRVHVSPTHFSRLFHRVMGRTFSHYLTEQRIRHAQVLLRHSTAPIGQIAQRCGFARQSYFTRRFRETCGMTPTQYRARETTHASRPADSRRRPNQAEHQAHAPS